MSEQYNRPIGPRQKRESRNNFPFMALVGTAITLGALFAGLTAPGPAIIALLAMACLLVDYRLLLILLALYIAGGVAFAAMMGG